MNELKKLNADTQRIQPGYYVEGYFGKVLKTTVVSS